jgi:hypothetical protein
VSEYLSEEQASLAETVRRTCIETAQTAYEDAAMSGLCHEGASECALDAMRGLDLAAITSRDMSSSPKRTP